MARIALTGQSKVGKTTLVEGLVKLGYVHVNYTDHLKKLLVSALNHIGVSATVDDIHRNKEKWRPLLIEWGHAIGYDEGAFVEDVLRGVSCDMFGCLTDECLPKDLVFDVVKQPAQWDILKRRPDLGFKLIRLEADELTRVDRGMRVSDMEPLPHQSGEKCIWTDGLTPDEVLAQVLDAVKGGEHDLGSQQFSLDIAGADSFPGGLPQAE